MKHWIDLSEDEAEAYLQQYVAESPAVVARLKSMWVESGESPDVLDSSPESLVPLWAWARARMEWRPGFRPPEYPGAPRENRYTWDDLESPDELPSWARYTLPDEIGEFSLETLWVVDMVSRYLNAMVIDAVPGARYEVGHGRHPGYAFENRPMLTYGDLEGRPLTVPYADASIVLQYPERDSENYLLDIYEGLVDWFKGETSAKRAADDTPWFSVDANDETGKWTYEVTVDELLGSAYETLVAQLISDLLGHPKIAIAVLEDRERILVSAPDLTHRQLHEWLEDWFDEHAPDDQPFGS